MEETKTIIYSEFKQTLSSLSLTLYDNRFEKEHCQPVVVEVEGSTVRVLNDYKETKFLLTDVELSPLTCRGLRLSPLGELSLTMQIDSASWKTIKPLKFETKVSYQEELIEKVQLHQDKCYCTRCGNKIITNHSFFKRILPLPSEKWASHTDMWFCHNHGNEESDYKSISLLPKFQECFISSAYFLIRASHLCAKELQNGDVICPRCHRRLGSKIMEGVTTVKNGIGNIDPIPVYKIFSQAVIFYNKNLLCEETRPGVYTEAFFAKLINEQSHMFTSFRLIVTGEEEGHKKIQCLIWLMDPDMLILKGEAAKECTEIRLQPRPVMKLLYKCHITDKSRSNTVKSDIFEEWSKDNSVHTFQLPYLLCFSLVTSLVKSTKELPKSQRHLNSFLLGYLHYDK